MPDRIRIGSGAVRGKKLRHKFLVITPTLLRCDDRTVKIALQLAEEKMGEAIFILCGSRDSPASADIRVETVLQRPCLLVFANSAFARTKKFMRV